MQNILSNEVMRETRRLLNVAQLSISVESIMETEHLPSAAPQDSGERDKRVLRVARLSMKENKT